MRFLVLTKSRTPAPPNPDLIDAMTAWLDQHEGSGKMEQSWAFAGITGGGGILNVDSHEELDAVMGGFPFAPFSSIEVYPLSDLRQSLETTRDQLEKLSTMTPQ